MNMTITLSATGDTDNQDELEKLKAFIDECLYKGAVVSKVVEPESFIRDDEAGQWKRLLMHLNREYPMRQILDLLVANNGTMMSPEIAERLNMNPNSIPPATSQLSKLCKKYNLPWPISVPMRSDGHREYILQNEYLKKTLESSLD